MQSILQHIDYNNNNIATDNKPQMQKPKRTKKWDEPQIPALSKLQQLKNIRTNQSTLKHSNKINSDSNMTFPRTNNTQTTTTPTNPFTTTHETDETVPLPFWSAAATCCNSADHKSDENYNLTCKHHNRSKFITSMQNEHSRTKPATTKSAPHRKRIAKNDRHHAASATYRPGGQLWRRTLTHLTVLLLAIECLATLMPAVRAEPGIRMPSTTPMQRETDNNSTNTHVEAASTEAPAINATKWSTANVTATDANNDSIFMRFARRFSTGNELWDGIVRDCYQQPSFSCFQKNVFVYLNEALEVQDVNVTQRLKFYKNQIDYAEMQEQQATTQAAMVNDEVEESTERGQQQEGDDEHLLNNEIPHEEGRAAVHAESPIEEVTNALYGKSIKFAMTHDVELKLPEMLFDGATFRISPRSFEGNGIIAKLELIPKQEVEARLAGKIIMKKIQKFLKSKLLLSFLALVLIIKIIKIKLFWLLPLVIGVGAAKKLLLKFLLFLFPALSHLFKLCSYYQQTYHSTKYHHHHHLINHHHTIVPAWHAPEHHNVPEIIYTQPPKGHISAYLHGAPIHETYGPPSHEHYDSGWENSGPGLGSDYISELNRVAQIDENSNYFKPHANDANEIHVWGLGTTQPTISQQQQQQKPPIQPLQQQQKQRYRIPATQQQRPPPPPSSLLQKQAPQQQFKQQQQHKQQIQTYQKPHATSHNNFNPFLNADKPSVFGPKFKTAQSAPNPVYVPPPQAPQPHPHPPIQGHGLTAAHIAAQYDPSRNGVQQQQQQQAEEQLQQQQLSPELAAQLKEALRIQAEQRIIAQQQKILDKQPFVQDGQPLMPKNYDPFYTPLLQKVDKIVEQLGVKDDACKERLVCSMYKDPDRYSPHSNFVSAELSRDTSELQPVTNTNPAVVRFYRFIQAARDGQDQRDCLRLYPQCSINTE